MAGAADAKAVPAVPEVAPVSFLRPKILDLFESHTGQIARQGRWFEAGRSPSPGQWRSESRHPTRSLGLGWLGQDKTR